MRYGLAMGVMVVLLASGCGPGDLSTYTARGPSAQPGTFGSLAYLPTTHLVADGIRGKAAKSKEVEEYYTSEIEFLFNERLTQPTFRSLCALLNTFFQNWDRLVIIERIAYEGELWYGYAVLAQTPSGPKAVTNMVADRGSRWGWECCLQPRQVRLEPRRVAMTLDMLDTFANDTANRGLLWFDTGSMPIFVLHYVRRDGRMWSTSSFGISGYGIGEKAWQKHEVESYFMSWEEISKLLSNNVQPECVSFESPRGGELKKVGASYANLMAIVWKCILGLEDATILGDDEEVTVLDQLSNSGDTHNSPRVKGVLP
jgi:hypothetical protein